MSINYNINIYFVLMKLIQFSKKKISKNLNWRRFARLVETSNVEQIFPFETLLKDENSKK